MSKRALLGQAFAVLALSGSIAGIAAGTAEARPNTNGLAAECRSANNGRWVVDRIDGRVTGYMCYYKDSSGDTYVDMYDRNGGYKGTG